MYMERERERFTPKHHHICTTMWCKCLFLRLYRSFTETVTSLPFFGTDHYKNKPLYVKSLNAPFYNVVFLKHYVLSILVVISYLRGF